MKKPLVNWRMVPKQALVDALRNSSLGASNLSQHDKADLVETAERAMRHPEKAAQLVDHLRTEVEYRCGTPRLREAFP